MIPTSVLLSVASQNAAAAAKAVALQQKKGLLTQGIRNLQGFGQQYTTAAQGRTSALLAQAEEARARAAQYSQPILSDMGTATAPEEAGATGGFFNSKALLIVGGAVAVLLLLRR